MIGVAEDLTKQKKEEVMLLCERLGISTATVKTHLSRIYGKLGITNRREAARKAKLLSLV